MSKKNTYDFAIIGAGIVGLSTALHLQRQNKNVLVLEKEKKPGLHQSGRNSGVIHSGIYYKPNSSKSELSIRGRNLLIEYLNERGINYRQEGKVVVDNDLDKLENLKSRSKELEMDGVDIVQDDDLLSIEPNSVIKTGLFVPQAGVVDYGEVVRTYADEFIELGGEIQFIEEIIEIENLKSRSKELEMDGVDIVQDDDLLSIEPNSVIKTGLFVPQAGVVDYGEVVRTYADEFIELGGEIEYIEEIIEIENLNNVKKIKSKNNSFSCEFLINCAGLFSELNHAWIG